jgi:hypothetical protein
MTTQSTQYLYLTRVEIIACTLPSAEGERVHATPTVGVVLCCLAITTRNFTMTSLNLVLLSLALVFQAASAGMMWCVFAWFCVSGMMLIA